MKTFALLLLALSVGFLRADPPNPAPEQKPTATKSNDWTVQGKTYHNVVVGIVEADRVHITYEGGIGTINLSDLPPDIQKQLGFDPQKAAIAQQLRAYEAEISDLKAENARLRAELSRSKGALTESQAAPKIGIEAFHTYLNQTIMPYWNGGHGFTGGPYAGMTLNGAEEAARQSWAQMSDDQKAPYEKMAQQTGDPGDPLVQQQERDTHFFR